MRREDQEKQQEQGEKQRPAQLKSKPQIQPFQQQQSQEEEQQQKQQNNQDNEEIQQLKARLQPRKMDLSQYDEIDDDNISTSNAPESAATSDERVKLHSIPITRIYSLKSSPNDIVLFFLYVFHSNSG